MKHHVRTIILVRLHEAHLYQCARSRNFLRDKYVQTPREGFDVDRKPPIGSGSVEYDVGQRMTLVSNESVVFKDEAMHV